MATHAIKSLSQPPLCTPSSHTGSNRRRKTVQVCRHRGPAEGVSSNGSTSLQLRRSSWTMVPVGSRSKGFDSVVCQSATAQEPTTLSAPSQDFMNEMKEFLKRDLEHLFDEQGIDKSKYDEKVEFRDPITSYDSVSGYLFNIQMLRRLFHPDFELKDVRQTGPAELTTRWTMKMYFWLLPWRPEVVFTGLSIMKVNPATGRFCSHVDIWDSIEDNKYFSLEGLKDLISQMFSFSKTPELEQPQSDLLVRRSNYEVRQYGPYTVIEGPMVNGEGPAGMGGFRALGDYIFGANATGLKMKMTVPVMTRPARQGESSAQVQVPLESSIARENLPSPKNPEVRLVDIPGGPVAAVRFGGLATDEVVKEKERELRAVLKKDGLEPEDGFTLARYNHPKHTQGFRMRNEVLIRLKHFELP